MNNLIFKKQRTTNVISFPGTVQNDFCFQIAIFKTSLRNDHYESTHNLHPGIFS